MPAKDITLTAKWDEIKEEHLKYTVTITFSKKNITKEEVEEKIISIVNEEEKYIEIKEEGDEIIVIISYDDKEKAEEIADEFIRKGAEAFIVDSSMTSTLH